MLIFFVTIGTQTPVTPLTLIIAPILRMNSIIVLTLRSIGLAGDIHFDDDEIWTINGEQDTTDYTWTALHEIGHALGLRHSREQDAVMWPWFTGYKPDTRLTQDDISGIQAIYGETNINHMKFC
jgi:hypothetical protein